MKKVLLAAVACILLSAAANVRADVSFTVDPAAPWTTWMNVSEIPENGGGYLWGSGWGINDLVSNFTGPVLTLAPNSVNDPSDYWYTPAGGPGATGNKWMDANIYQESSAWTGQKVTFSGSVLSNTFVAPYYTEAFIKDFAPDYSSSVEIRVPLTTLGPFTASLDTIADPARHVQFGFSTQGPTVWITDAAAKGNIQLTATPTLKADFDHNGQVNSVDLGIWKGAFNLTAAGDANGDLISDGADLLIWQRELHPTAGIGAVPEPAAAVLALAGFAALASRRRRAG